MVWDPEPDATGYHIWTVKAKREIELARITSAPPAIGILGCSPPSPVAGEICTDVDAIPRDFPSVLFYQVRGVCGPSAEGP